MDLGGGVGNSFDVVALELDLVLLVFVVEADDAWDALGGVHFLATDEVTDFNDGAVLVEGEFHWEVCVSCLHHDLETLGDSDDHVLDVRCDGAWHGVEFAAWEPDGDADVLSSVGDVEWAHVEVALELAAWTFDGDFLSIDRESDALWDLDCNGVFEMH